MEGLGAGGRGRGLHKEWRGAASPPVQRLEVEGLLTLKKITLYRVDRGQKFVRLWQLLEVLGFVAPLIPHFSVVMRGGDLQYENGPELAFRGAARRLGTEAGGTMLYSKISWGEQGTGT